MSIESLFDLEGQWEGTYKLWFSSPDPHCESSTSAGIKKGVRGTCVKIAYDWVYEDKPQEGLLIFSFDPNRELVRMAWFDSFHMANDFLSCEGFAAEGAVNVAGSYNAPVGPAWRWRTVIEPGDGDDFRMLMYNIHPNGTEEIAVEAAYARTKEE